MRFFLRTRDNDPLLHRNAQTPHPRHTASSVTGLFFPPGSGGSPEVMVLASIGQARLHLPHPVHVSRLVSGRKLDVMTMLVYPHFFMPTRRWQQSLQQWQR